MALSAFASGYIGGQSGHRIGKCAAGIGRVVTTIVAIIVGMFPHICGCWCLLWEGEGGGGRMFPYGCVSDLLFSFLLLPFRIILCGYSAGAQLLMQSLSTVDWCTDYGISPSRFRSKLNSLLLCFYFFYFFNIRYPRCVRSACLPTCLLACLFVCLSVSVSVCLPIWFCSLVCLACLSGLYAVSLWELSITALYISVAGILCSVAQFCVVVSLVFVQSVNSGIYLCLRKGVAKLWTTKLLGKVTCR